MTKLKEQHALDAIADTVLAYRPKARSNTMTGIVAMAMNTDEYGLNVDMLDVDRLRDWARLIDVHGDHISDWGDPKFVSGKLRDIADRLADEVRDVGTLRALVREASEIMQITYAGNFPAGIESFLVRAQQAGTGNQDAPPSLGSVPSEAQE